MCRSTQYLTSIVFKVSDLRCSVRTVSNRFG